MSQLDAQVLEMRGHRAVARLQDILVIDLKTPTIKLRPVYYLILFMKLGNVYKGMFTNCKSQLGKKKPLICLD